jgi:hypothetical protein
MALYNLSDAEAEAVSSVLKVYVEGIAPVGGFKSLPVETRTKVSLLESVLDELYNGGV